MGASAVLLFAAPNVPFAQPWNIIGGHVISAVIGVMCYDFIPDITIAASASVGFATGAMYFARCIHPPGGATALAAVIGSEKLHDLGYSFVFEPILLNTVTIFLVAIIFNSFFKWRKYPASWPFRQGATVSISKEKYAPINYDDFVYAMNHIDTPVDINEVDLLKIYKIATNRDMNSKDNSCK